MQDKVEWCLRGFLWSVGDDARSALLAAVTVCADAEWIARLYRCAPFGRHTWRLLDQYDSEVRDRYWREVMPEWCLYTEAELIELIDCLLDAKRPRAAFYIAHLDWSKIGTLRLKRLLFEIGTVDTELAAHYLPESFDISEALSALNARGGVDQDEMARLEFMYIEALEYSEHGMPNLERWISESPIGFVQILALVFKRNDGGQDPPEWHIVQAEKRTALASAADGLLARISRIPGIGDGGEIDVEVLAQWIAEARRLCTEHGRATIDDQYIGQILARAPADEDGLQPALSD